RPGLSRRSASAAAKLSPTQLYSGRPERFSKGIVTIVSVAAPRLVSEQTRIKMKDRIACFVIAKNEAGRQLWCFKAERPVVAQELLSRYHAPAVNKIGVIKSGLGWKRVT